MVKSETCLYTPPEHVKGVLFLRFCMKTWEQLSDTCKSNKKKYTHISSISSIISSISIWSEYLLTWVLLAGSAVPFFSNYKCISVWAQVLTTPKIFKTLVLLWNSETFQCWILWWHWPLLNKMETAIHISQFRRLNDTHLFPTHLLVSTRNLLLHPEGKRENTACFCQRNSYQSNLQV